jgi:serine protease Do
MKRATYHHRAVLPGTCSRTLLFAVLLVFLTTGFFTTCSGKDEQAKKAKAAPVTSEKAEVSTARQPQTQDDWTTAIERVAEKAIPSVVHVEVTEYQEVTNPMFPFENDPFFGQFFGIPKGPRKFKRELKGLGSGIIMDAKGHILTNNHVAGGASKIDVLLADGRHYPAKLVGADPKTDLAVISISAQESLSIATFGDSDKVKVGQWVVAIGQPLGLSQTVTQGIISAKHRVNIENPSSYEDFLQTDAPINPGNSGGPLLNLQGEVIGINSAIMTQSGGSEGLGFAIPSNMAIQIAKQLIAHGKVVRGWLGVSVQNLTPDLAKSFGAKSLNGVLIADVVKGGPADKAGLERGDIILTFGGKEVKDADRLRNEVAITPIGEETKMTVFRDGKQIELTVKVGNMADAAKFYSSSVKARLGITVGPVTKEEMEKYGLEPQQGVAIMWVDRKGPLGRAGFEVGDIILQVNKRAVTSVQDLDALTNTLGPKQGIMVLALDHRTGEKAYDRVTTR